MYPPITTFNEVVIGGYIYRPITEVVIGGYIYRPITEKVVFRGVDIGPTQKKTI
jgi:hypothetical protein